MPDFSTLGARVLKVYTFVTHSDLQGLIIQTVSKNKLISKNAYVGSADSIGASRWRKILFQIL